MGSLKDSYWLKHDSNARHDPKIIALCTKYGAQGYGWYWILVEMMREQKDYMLKINGPHSIALYQRELYATAEEVNLFIEDCITEYDDGGFGLFSTDGTHFWSESLLRRMEKMEEAKKRQSEAGKKGNKKRWSSGTRSLPDTDPIATREDKKRKDKTYAHLFSSFWASYPKKVSKQAALKAWCNLKPDEELASTIVTAVERYKNTKDWQKEDGKYVPYPATFLNGKRWEDEIDAPAKRWDDFD
jgi:hypothetical protein